MNSSIVAAVALALSLCVAGSGVSFANENLKPKKVLFPAKDQVEEVSKSKHRKKVLFPSTESKAETGHGEQRGGNKKIASIVKTYARKYGLPGELAHAVIRVESNYNPRARGSAGEIGLMQIKPATARMMGYSGSARGLYDPETNIRYGMKYLAMAYDLGGGDTCRTILKYNAGHAAKRMNPVSAAYCHKVQRILR